MFRDGSADSSIVLSLAITDTSGTAFGSNLLPTIFPVKGMSSGDTGNA